MNKEISDKNKVKKYFIVGVFLLIVAISIYLFDSQKTDSKIQNDMSGNSIIQTYSGLSPQAKALYHKQSEGLTKEVPQRLVELDQLTIGCFGTSSILQMSSSDKNLGGQCCGALKDVEAYNIQLKALERFIRKNGNIDLIPKDPYDVSVEHAQKLINFDKTITLSSSQQLIYDNAIDMSHHGGPCCCKCWKWYVMSGLAKKLIVDYSWNENQIAELWDTSSSCGHSHDTNMHEHYSVPEGEEIDHSHEQSEHDHDTMKIFEVESTLITNPTSVQAGEQTILTFQLKKDGETINDLVAHHARKLHVVVISEDLDIFGHIHPKDFDYDNLNGKYSVDFTFPKSGKYLVAINGMTNEGKFSEQFVINIDGSPKQGEMFTNYNIKSSVNGNIEESIDKFTNPIIFSKVDDGDYEIILNAPKLQKNKQTTLSFTILKNGSPLNDLTNYLDAPIHFALVKDDFSDFMHEHGTLPGGEHDAEIFGPALELKTTFKNSGMYQLIGQVKHENKIIIFPFSINVDK